MNIHKGGEAPPVNCRVIGDSRNSARNLPEVRVYRPLDISDAETFSWCVDLRAKAFRFAQEKKGHVEIPKTPQVMAVQLGAATLRPAIANSPVSPDSLSAATTVTNHLDNTFSCKTIPISSKEVRLSDQNGLSYGYTVSSTQLQGEIDMVQDVFDSMFDIFEDTNDSGITEPRMHVFNIVNLDALYWDQRPRICNAALGVLWDSLGADLVLGQPLIVYDC